MMWGMHMGYGAWGFFITAILWIGLIALGVWVLARLFPKGGDNVGSRHEGTSQARAMDPPESALEILQRRYARGELTKEEYETIRHDLAR